LTNDVGLLPSFVITKDLNIDEISSHSNFSKHTQEVLNMQPLIGYLMHEIISPLNNTKWPGVHVTPKKVYSVLPSQKIKTNDLSS
jgi:hypothetical protein